MGLKDLFKNPSVAVVEGVIKGVGDAVDRFVFTKEEKAKLKAELEKEITNRWSADANSDSWLSKNVRPLSMLWVMVMLTLLWGFDGNLGEFSIDDNWIPMIKDIALTIFGGYFLVREAGKLINKI